MVAWAFINAFLHGCIALGHWKTWASVSWNFWHLGHLWSMAHSILWRLNIVANRANSSLRSVSLCPWGTNLPALNLFIQHGGRSCHPRCIKNSFQCPEIIDLEILPHFCHEKCYNTLPPHKVSLLQCSDGWNGVICAEAYNELWESWTWEQSPVVLPLKNSSCITSR